MAIMFNAPEPNRILSTLLQMTTIRALQARFDSLLAKCAALQTKPLSVRLAAAVLIVAIAFGVRWWLMGQVGQVGPRLAYPVFYPAVMIAALVGGAAAGVLSVALSVMVVMLWVMPHQSSTDWLGTAIFIVASAPTVCLTAALQNAQLKLREAATKRNNDLRLGAVFDQQFQFMAILDPDGRLEAVNDMPLIKDRLRREDLLGLPFADMPWFHNLPDLRADWPRRLAEAARQTGPVTYSDTYSAGDSSLRTADASVTAVRAEDDSVSFFIVQAHDTTEHKQAANALRESAEQMRLAVDVAQLGFFDHDHWRDTLSWSPRMRRILGFTSEQPVSLPGYVELIHPADRAGIVAAIERAHDPANDGGFRVEHRVVLRDGQIRWLALRAQTMFGGEGDARRRVRTIGVLIDVTDRKQAEHHQNMLVAELDHRVKNTLELVSRLVEFSRQNAKSMSAFIDTFEGRIQSMAKAHELLSRNRWHDMVLSEVVRQQLAAFGGPERIAIVGDDIRLKPAVAQALAMLLHELATNAAKYGALSSEHGRVSVAWHRTSPPTGQANRTQELAGGLMLTWHETGGPPVVPPARSGFGSALIRELVEYELDGKVDLVFAPAGVHCEVVIPALGLERRRQLTSGSPDDVVGYRGTLASWPPDETHTPRQVQH